MGESRVGGLWSECPCEYGRRNGDYCGEQDGQGIGDDRKTAILTPHWVSASAIEYYGRNDPLPPVVSPHNAYYFWREEAAGRDVVISVGVHPDALAEAFGRTRELGVFRCEYCAHFRPDQVVHLSHDPKRPLEQLIGDWKHFGILPAEKLQR